MRVRAFAPQIILLGANERYAEAYWLRCSNTKEIRKPSGANCIRRFFCHALKRLKVRVLEPIEILSQRLTSPKEGRSDFFSLSCKAVTKLKTYHSIVPND